MLYKKSDTVFRDSPIGMHSPNKSLALSDVKKLLELNQPKCGIRPNHSLDIRYDNYECIKRNEKD